MHVDIRTAGRSDARRHTNRQPIRSTSTYEPPADPIHADMRSASRSDPIHADMRSGAPSTSRTSRVPIQRFRRVEAMTPVRLLPSSSTRALGRADSAHPIAVDLLRVDLDTHPGCRGDLYGAVLEHHASSEKVVFVVDACDLALELGGGRRHRHDA